MPTAPADLIEAYPHLTVEHIRAAIMDAAKTVSHESRIGKTAGRKVVRRRNGSAE
jgi:uncharacterized protein (DUF433 family)